jgi:23S rRNA (adenine2030-N6)-methyltransferase
MPTENEYTYSHFAKPADVWKHLALCEVMRNEQPKVYVETNSACADYHLNHTPEQEYGIYYFLKEAENVDNLSESTYYDLENYSLKENKYLGSPGLAMRVLGSIVDKFHFFDIETLALANVIDFARRNRLTDKVETINQDSIIGVLDLLPELPGSTLIHIDPYTIDKPSVNGKDYLDVFAQASEQGMKCILWYGFNTLDEKKQLNDYMMNKLSDKAIRNLSCTELIMDIIRKNTILCNPGILGNGLLTSNMSNTSISAIENYSKSLTKLYRNSRYNGFKGSIYRDVLDI